MQHSKPTLALTHTHTHTVSHAQVTEGKNLNNCCDHSMITCMRIKPVKAMQKNHWGGLIALSDEWFNTTTHDTTFRISNLQL
jgi:hypothetical protein